MREHYVLADRNFILDIRAAKRDLDWEPRYDNESMLIEAYDWYLTADASYRPTPHPVLRMLEFLTSLRSRPS